MSSRIERLLEKVRLESEREAARKPSSGELYLLRKQHAAEITRKTAPLLAKADEMAAKYLAGEMLATEAFPPIDCLLSEIGGIYRRLIPVPRPPAPPMRQGLVYVIKDSSGLHKIGHTRSIKQRRQSLQAATATKITVVFCKRVGMWPRAAELHLHKHFVSKRVRGEWFALTNDDLQKIDGLLNQFLEEQKIAWGSTF